MVESHQGQEDQRPKVGGLALKQLHFNWDTADKIHRMESIHVRGKKGDIHL